MIRIDNHTLTLFKNVQAAERAIKLMGLEKNEYRINVDPKGSGRCRVDVLDPDDGEKIGEI